MLQLVAHLGTLGNVTVAASAIAYRTMVEQTVHDDQNSQQQQQQQQQLRRSSRKRGSAAPSMLASKAKQAEAACARTAPSSKKQRQAAAPVAAAVVSINGITDEQRSARGSVDNCSSETAQQPGTKCNSGAPAANTTCDGVAPVLNAFEAERAARIAANMARLAALELPQLAAAIIQPLKQRQQQRPQKGVSSKRNRSEQQQQPVRQSARTRGQAADFAAGIAFEGRDGQVVLAEPGRWTGTAASHSSTAAAATPRPPPGPMPFASTNGSDATDAAFVAMLAAQAGAAAAAAGEVDCSSSSPGVLPARGGLGRGATPAGCGAGSAAAAAAAGADLAKLQLAEHDVAKMTKEGISCLAVHPGIDKLIVAAADKSGKVRGSCGCGDAFSERERRSRGKIKGWSAVCLSVCLSVVVYQWGSSPEGLDPRL
jgi:hypothetical protein